MADLRENGPYIWVTWLTKLMVGENSCEHSSWFKAQHESGSWAKAPSDFNQVGWLLSHTAAINKNRDLWEEGGYQTLTEGQNSFAWETDHATIGGKPDLIALKDEDGTIIDVKTGRPSPSHIVQVMLYMHMLPRALPQYEGKLFDGLVVYPDHEVPISPLDVNQPFLDALSALVERLASQQQARKVPSLGECRFCDITLADCPERLERQPKLQTPVGAA